MVQLLTSASGSFGRLLDKMGLLGQWYCRIIWSCW